MSRQEGSAYIMNVREISKLIACMNKCTQINMIVKLIKEWILLEKGGIDLESYTKNELYNKMELFEFQISIFHGHSYYKFLFSLC